MRPVLFCGDPDTVYEQMVRFNEAVGGYFEQQLMMHAWDMTQDETLKSIRLFGEEVRPRLENIDVDAFAPAAA